MIKNTVKINYVSGTMDRSVFVLILLIISISTFAFSVYRFTTSNDLMAYILLGTSIVLTIATLFCGAYLISIIHITPTRFILFRPYAKFWITKIETELINISLNDIATIYIQKDVDYENVPKGSWKITLKNKSTVSFPYIADLDDLQSGIRILSSKGIIVYTLKP